MNFFILIIFELFINILCQNQIWKFESSSIDLLKKGSYNYIIYNETNFGVEIKLEKTIEKINNRIVEKNTIQRNNEEKKEIEFEDIYRFYSFPFLQYICPKGKHFLHEYSYNKVQEFIYPQKENSDNWLFSCYYYNNRIYISYLGSKDNNIYVFNVIRKKWENITITLKESNYKIYDIIWPNKNNINNMTYVMTLLLKEKSLFLTKIVIANSFSTIYETNMRYINNLKNNAFAFFDDDKYIYWLTYDEKELFSGYSNTPIPENISNFDPNNNEMIDLTMNLHSPFESMEKVTINYIYSIKNTKYAYYQINSNSIIYHGIIDIKLNKIIFNTNEVIIEYKPLTKYSLLAITYSSAFEICIYGKDNGKCREECEQNEKLIIDKENGNSCGPQDCNILFRPNNTCIDYCNESIYTKNDDECGPCQLINESYPFKIINEKNCIKEMPNNAYYIDKSLNLIDFCHNSCETCYGKQEDNCLSCNNNTSFLYNNICCDYNCKTCNKGKEGNNNNCASCDNYTFLVLANGFDNNCVSECPKNTKLDNFSNTCIDGDGDGDENVDNNNNNKSKIWVWILIISLGVIIIAVVGIIIFLKFCRRDNEDEIDVVLKSEDDFSVDQSWSIYE